ncbi:helix-turn-helix transcriptional regulator [Leucobacter sp. 1207-22]
MPDPDFTQLRFVIARAREQRKVTQEELAALSGVSRQAILDIGSGKTRGSIETWVRLARALNISVDELTAPIWGIDETGTQSDPVN